MCTTRTRTGARGWGGAAPASSHPGGYGGGGVGFAGFGRVLVCRAASLRNQGLYPPARLRWWVVQSDEAWCP